MRSEKSFSATVARLKVSGIRVTGLSKGKNLLGRSGKQKCFIKISLIDGLGGEISKQSVSAARNAISQWPNDFQFDHLPESILKFEIHAIRTLGSPKLMGLYSEEVQSLLLRAQKGAVYCKLANPAGEHSISNGVLEFFITSETALGESSPMEGATLASEVQSTQDSLAAMRGIDEKVVGKMEEVSLIQAGLANSAGIADAWLTLLERVEVFSNLVDKLAEIHPYAKMAWSLLSLTHKIVIAQVDRDARITHLAATMADAYSFLQESEPLEKVYSLKQLSTLLSQQTAECVYFIRDYSKNQSFWKRTLKNLVSQVDSTIQSFEDKFKEIKEAFGQRITLRTGITVVRIVDVLESTTAEVILNDMPYAEDARHRSEKRCLEGTRTAVIDDIIAWVNSDPSDPASKYTKILMLSGVAGSGKSAIAHTLAGHFDQIKRLGSSYCFNRSEQVHLNPSNLFSTISRNLADLELQWRHALLKVVENNRSLRTTHSVQEQFDAFLLKPAAELRSVGPIVIVIDALDESGDAAARKVMLSTLARRVTELPPNFRIILTSRPEVDIQSYFFENELVSYRSMDNLPNTGEDIIAYIDHELQDVSELEKEWPNKEWLPVLSKKAEGLFQWAFTACLFVKGDANEWGYLPTEQMKLLTSSSEGQTELERLDQLYLDILNRVFSSTGNPKRVAERMTRYRSVLGQVVAAKEPLPLSALVALKKGGAEAGMVEPIIRPLGALLSGVSSRDAPVRPLHTSFRDFLTDQDRSGPFFVDITEHQESLFEGCLQSMTGLLRFNICNLPSSYISNRDVPDLEQRIREHIPVHLSYSCRFWASHLQISQFQTSVAGQLKAFLKKFTLFWLEVLALLEQLEHATQALSALMEWGKVSPASSPLVSIPSNKNPVFEDTYLVDLSGDIGNFISMFGAAFSESVPHLYLSALPFIPKRSAVSFAFLPAFRNTVNVARGKLADWPRLRRQFYLEQASKVEFTPDGSKLLSVSTKGIFCTWNLASSRGETNLLSIPKGVDGINSVAISHDCRSIASASTHLSSYNSNESWQAVVWVCDSGTGELRTVHEAIAPESQLSRTGSELTFSPNGKLLVAGFHNRNIYIWSLTSKLPSPQVSFKQPGSRKSGPRHLTSIVISPDNQILATTNYGAEVFLWRTEDGQLIRQFDELTPEHPIAFTRDGSALIVSDDPRCVEICVVGIDSGQVIGRFGRVERILRIMSVGVSKTGLVASVHSGGAICVRDVKTGTLLHLFQDADRDHRIEHLSFSLDGSSLAGIPVARNKSLPIRVWDLRPTASLASLETTAAKSFYLNARISPDLELIAASYRTKLSVRNCSTGKLLFEISQPEECGPIESLNFTPFSDRVLSGSTNGSILLWDSRIGTILPKQYGKGYTSVLSITDVWQHSSGSRFAALYSNQVIRLWDMDSGDLIACWDGSQWFNLYSGLTPLISLSDGSHLAIGDSSTGIVYLINSDTGQLAKELSVGDEASGISHVTWGQTSVGAVPNDVRHSRVLVAGSRNGHLLFWDIANGSRWAGPPFRCRGLLASTHKLQSHNIEHSAFSPANSFLAAACNCGNVTLCDWVIGEHLAGPLKCNQPILSLAFSSDGSRLICAREDASACIWDINNVIELAKRTSSAPSTSEGSTQSHKGSIDGSTDSKLWFNDISTPDSETGWLKGPNGELLLWIPPPHRTNLMRPSNVGVETATDVTKLDFSRFIAGEAWTGCYTSDEDSKRDNSV